MSTSVPKTNKVIQYTKVGGPEVIEQVEVETATPKPDEILVKIEWAGVNFIDTYFRTGVYPVTFPFSAGQEGSGEIVSLPTSPEVLESDDYKKRGFKVGSKVVVYFGHSFQEYSAVPWHKVAVLPEGISTKVGAAGFTQGLTALSALKEAYAVQKGDWILVHAIAGGLGLQFAQLGKLFGANIIGTTSSAEKAEVAKKHGADHVLLYTKGPIIDDVLKITNGVGAQAVYDGVGKDTWEDNFQLIARKGTIVSIGNASGAVPPFAPLKLVAKNLKVLRPTLNNYIFTPEEFRQYSTEYFEFLKKGVHVEIHKEYPFTAEGVRQSQIDITGRGTIGKLLINVAGGN